MKKYVTTKHGCEIDEVEVEKETEKSVWINGDRHSKSSSYNTYHNSFEDAKNHLITTAENRIKSAKFQVEVAESFLKNVESQVEPKRRK